MRVLNYGSMNLDYVYTVASFVTAGQTACALTRNVYGGGKRLEPIQYAGACRQLRVSRGDHWHGWGVTAEGIGRKMAWTPISCFGVPV